MESKEIAQAIAELMSRKKAKDVVMIDIAEKSSFADYFVIATGTSDRQLGALADEVEDFSLSVFEFDIEPITPPPTTTAITAIKIILKGDFFCFISICSLHK